MFLSLLGLNPVYVPICRLHIICCLCPVSGYRSKASLLSNFCLPGWRVVWVYFLQTKNMLNAIQAQRFCRSVSLHFFIQCCSFVVVCITCIKLLDHHGCSYVGMFYSKGNLQLKEFEAVRIKSLLDWFRDIFQLLTQLVFLVTHSVTGKTTLTFKADQTPEEGLQSEELEIRVAL